MTQRRNYDRFMVKGCALAVYRKPRRIGLLRPKVIKIGPVVNISRGGMAFEYIENQKRAERFYRISVAIPDKGILISQFPVRRISDIVKAEVAGTSRIRRRALQFGLLNQHQVFRLNRFIKYHTHGFVPDRRSGFDRRYNGNSGDPFIAIPGWANDRGRRRGEDRRRLALI